MIDLVRRLENNRTAILIEAATTPGYLFLIAQDATTTLLGLERAPLTRPFRLYNQTKDDIVELYEAFYPFIQNPEAIPDIIVEAIDNAATEWIQEYVEFLRRRDKPKSVPNPWRAGHHLGRLVGAICGALIIEALGWTASIAVSLVSGGAGIVLKAGQIFIKAEKLVQKFLKRRNIRTLRRIVKRINGQRGSTRRPTLHSPTSGKSATQPRSPVTRPTKPATGTPSQATPPAAGSRGSGGATTVTPPETREPIARQRRTGTSARGTDPVTRSTGGNRGTTAQDRKIPGSRGTEEDVNEVKGRATSSSDKGLSLSSPDARSRTSEKIAAIEQFREELDPEARDRFDSLPPEEQDQLVRRTQILETFSDAQERLPGRREPERTERITSSPRERLSTLRRGNFRAALEARYGPPPSGHDAHHIVPENISAAAPAQDALEFAGIDIHDPRNGIWLPSSPDVPNPNATTLHANVHTPLYIRTLNERLVRARNTGRTEAQQIESIRRELSLIFKDIAETEFPH